MTPTTLLCPVCSETDTVLGVIERGTYDGVLYWECEADGARWHRWPEGHWLFHKAEPHVRGRERGGLRKVGGDS
jgi:hypothetical protein